MPGTSGFLWPIPPAPTTGTRGEPGPASTQHADGIGRTDGLPENPTAVTKTDLKNFLAPNHKLLAWHTISSCNACRKPSQAAINAYFMYHAGNLSIGKRASPTVEKLLTFATRELSQKKCGSGRGGGNLVRTVVEEYHWPSLIHRKKVSDCSITSCSAWMNSAKCLGFLQFLLN